MRPNVKLRRQSRRYSLAGSHESQVETSKNISNAFPLAHRVKKKSNFLLGCSESEI